MFTFTKRELNLLALSLTLFILLVYNLVLFPLINSIFNYNTPKIYSNYVYSKTIPISQENKISDYVLPVYKLEQQKTNVQNTANNTEVNETKIGNNAKKTTQRDIIKENQNIKWRIQIPKINLDVHIMEGTTSNILLKAVGHFEETSKLNGNVGLAAHNRGYQCNFFANIKKLKVGDEIIYITENSKRVYKIQTNKVIKDTDWSYLKDTDDNRITLITCEEYREEYRRCIQAIEISSYKI